MCGQHNVRASDEDSTGQNADKRHTPSPRIGNKIPDPAGIRTRAAGLEGKDGWRNTSEYNIVIKKFIILNQNETQNLGLQKYVLLRMILIY